MKNSLILYVIFSFILALSSCSLDEFNEESSHIDMDESVQKRSNPSLPIRSKNELIISFFHKTPQGIRKRLREKYKVKRYERCNCSNERIEKWVFQDGADVEERMGDITQETDVEGTDFQFYNIKKDKNTQLPITTNPNSSAISLVNTHPNTVNIGVLDTGINLDIMRKTTPFLYNSNDNNRCKENGIKEISGWDFVNQDNDPFDELGHGTAVTDRILNELDKNPSVNYSILPVKVFNHLGQGNTFDILCGYLYTANKGNIRVINMSFGWYGSPSKLMDLYISQNSHIFHITSAGNNDSNNDKIAHFPSSIDYNNVLAIGSYSIKESHILTLTKSSFSNYGNTTVDYLSVGENLFFEDVNHNLYPINGTSYAAPMVTAKVASYIYEVAGPSTIPEILYKLWDNAKIVPRNTLPVYYSDRIIN